MAQQTSADSTKKIALSPAAITRLSETLQALSISQTFPLRLPSELRLEVYKYCTAFSLLNLSLACRQMRDEINGEEEILIESPGYIALIHGSPNLNFNNIRVTSPEEAVLWYRQAHPDRAKAGEEDTTRIFMNETDDDMDVKPVCIRCYQASRGYLDGDLVMRLATDPPAPVEVSLLGYPIVEGPCCIWEFAPKTKPLEYGD
ncbi:hypothetical protein BJ508DRAFT_340447 [Ascobolus immersus RN42]|uniref:F-box domain-containing protein n=1 Tax=Ascobolus immersus RN42 TaxID=1160509 RepID=A0A3N4IK36_ASCIM|nr:hypothetical protein BJ508DRAFT_340447 [Ascobolus immersus RN42]